MTNILDDDELGAPAKPDFRRVGRGIAYVVGLNGKRTRYGRFSNAGKILDDESNLTDWKLRTQLVGAANRPDLMAMVSTLDPKADRNEIRDIAEQCLVSGKGKERTVKGTAIHSMFDHIDRGDDWEPAPQWVDLCNSYRNVLDLWGLVPEDIEVQCVHDELRLAGTIDRRYRTEKLLVAPDMTTVPIGSRVAADTKTGATLEYASGSYATQLAGYAHSVRYNVETDEREPWDPPTFPDWGLIIHADSGSTEVQLFWVDLNAGMEGLQLAQQVKKWRTRDDLLTLGAASWAPGAPILASAAPVVPEGGSRAVSLHLHTRKRVQALLAYSEVAGKALARQWPPGVPGLKQEGHSMEQLQAINAAVDSIETLYSVPFYPAWDDPAREPSMGRHPSSQPVVREPVPESIHDKINAHPRKELLKSWVEQAVAGGINPDIDSSALSNALLEFASIPTNDWPTEPQSHDEALTVFLEGTLRALGYTNGLLDLGNIDPNHAPDIQSAAFAITAGTGMLLYQEDGTCVFRTNIRKG